MWCARPALAASPISAFCSVVVASLAIRHPTSGWSARNDPIAARLRGIYLGVASLGLVFIGQHVLNTWTSVTGGFNGRTAPGFELFGFSISSSEDYLAVFGVPYGGPERLWYLGLLLAIAATRVVSGAP